MKGLLIKDIKLLLKNKRMIGCMLVIAAIMFVTNKTDYAFLIGYFAMLSTIFATSTISTDTADKSIAFLMTMPITRTIYVVEKYLLLLLSCLFGSLIAAIGSIIMQPEKYQEILLQTAAIFAILILAQLIMMPVNFKYGREKGLIVMLLIYGVVAIFFATAGKINQSQAWISIASLNAAIKWFSSLSAWIIGAAACLLLLLSFAVSYHISSRIVRKQEF